MLGTKAPDFTLQAFHNNEVRAVSLADYKSQYVVIVFYPFDFTFVCPTELNAFSEKASKFKELNTQVLYASCDSVFVHKAWAEKERSEGGVKGIFWPMLSDVKREMVTSYGMLNDSGVAYRGTVVLGKDHTIRHIDMYDDKIGRNVDEVIRIVGNMKLLDENKGQSFCPVNFKVGDK